MQTTVHEQVLEMTRRILKKDRFEMKSETSLIKEIAEEPIPEDIEFDVVVGVPPVKEQTVLVRVKGREKAAPHVVEPEGI